MSLYVGVTNHWFPNGATHPDVSRESQNRNFEVRSWIDFRILLLPSDFLFWWDTWRTETSQYPEEKKTIVIALVAASESATA